MDTPGDELWDRAMRGDAFGEMLRAAYRQEPSFGVLERDDGLVTPHDPRGYLAPPTQWSELDRVACRRVVGRVLDVGCGSARHAIYLQAKGFDVSGVDPSPGACEVARSRGLRTVHELDVEDLGKLDEAYDTILLLGANLALLGSPRKAATVLEALAAVASPNARVLGQTIDPYATTDPSHLEYHARNRSRGRMPGQLKVRPRFRRLVGPWVELLYCSVEELRTLVALSPWRLAAVDPAHDGSAAYLAELRLR